MCRSKYGMNVHIRVWHECDDGWWVKLLVKYEECVDMQHALHSLAYFVVEMFLLKLIVDYSRAGTFHLLTLLGWAQLLTRYCT